MLATSLPPFNELFREHAPYAGRVLRNLGVSDAELPDALQEAFLVVHRKLAGFRGESSLRTWIYGICLRVAAAHRRRPHRGREVELDETVEATGATPHEAAERREALSRLDAALGELDDDKRAVFVLYELEELTLAEVASAVGAPVPTVYSRLLAARRLIQSVFYGERAAAQKGEER